ncbi:hypothetical protein BKA70DRAFT_1406754 [Coprinopsis sp. MPI-PUGE-AT-0042]|nr:hypothetical protein BKA70DRAFT_1406754 [Coprinopsis sp. MPI-PUGE-AT-0042]
MSSFQSGSYLDSLLLVQYPCPRLLATNTRPLPVVRRRVFHLHTGQSPDYLDIVGFDLSQERSVIQTTSLISLSLLERVEHGWQVEAFGRTIQREEGKGGSTQHLRRKIRVIGSLQAVLERWEYIGEEKRTEESESYPLVHIRALRRKRSSTPLDPQDETQAPGALASFSYLLYFPADI